MSAIALREIEGRSAGYYGLLAGLGLIMLLGLGSAYTMEEHGHVVTGMDNQIVWGMPHVFAVFLIVAASGALNVASIASVFGKTEYKPLSPLSGLLALALLAGGLMVLVLDLGRPDRLVVAMTHYNFKSIFAWNVFLYNGFFVIVGAYLWAMMDYTGTRYVRAAGMAAFLWRLILTTGTGSIFGFLAARQAYDSALLAPMFIVFSLAYGTAIFLLTLIAACRGAGRELGDALLKRLRGLLAVFVAASLYFVAVFHVTNLYITQHDGFERFLLLEGGVHTFLFWTVQVGIGGAAPLVLLLHPALNARRGALVLASALVVIGGLAQMYVTIIGGQAYPLVLFPGMQETSGFYDGQVHGYAPSLPETMLGLSGIAVALLIVAVSVKMLRFLPERLADTAGEH
ncbi:MAG: polysulfide reductase NrfD [Betaproteobacteria bacterium]|nr:polysulfide reductase NrfD [Betaproteobacteria bacterium]